VLAKILAVVPNKMRSLIDDPSIGTPPTRDVDRLGIDYSRLRQWCRQGRKLAVFYRDETGVETRRLIWPFMLRYVATLRVVIAWCEMRTNFRILRTDRIIDIEFSSLGTLSRRVSCAQDGFQAQGAGQGFYCEYCVG
jgi:predicted DNA-binding transcriptional regulator YafY